MDKEKIKKTIILNLPLVLVFWLADKICFAYRTADGIDIYTKFSPFIENFKSAAVNPLPSINPIDLIVGIIAAVIFKLFVDYKRKNAKNFRSY